MSGGYPNYVQQDCGGMSEQVRALKVGRVPLEIIGGRDRRSKSLTRVGQRLGMEEWGEVGSDGWMECCRSAEVTFEHDR